ncbi:MAG: hypothetical protein VYE64_08895 [Planctomycetota bacterium]|nr:hypothetical protein [Planctomycetota bacterium]
MASISGKRIVFVLMIFGIALSTLGGCREPYPLRGSVEIDGTIVKSGSIIFQPDTASGGSGPSATTRIFDGNFIVPAGQKVPNGPTIAVITDGAQPGRKLEAKFAFPAKPTEGFLIIAKDVVETD